MDLSSAKKMVDENIEKGLECPCCEQWTQRYRYSFHAGMVKALAYIHMAYVLGEVAQGEFFHVERYLKEKKVNFHGYHSKLKFWGLIEQMDNTNPMQKASGFWKITEKGKQFANGEISVPLYAWLHNKELFKLDGPEVFIAQIKTKNFSYAEMMSAGR